MEGRRKSGWRNSPARAHRTTTRSLRRRYGTVRRFLSAAGAWVLAIVLLLQPAHAAARPTLDALAQSLGTDFEGLLSSELLLPGDSVSDWVALAAGRCGGASDTYLKKLRKHVTDAYGSDGGLDRAKATEWHRISLTVLALGGDPTAFGKDAHGHPINLIADGTYNWHTTDTLGIQGLNAWIFALITLDAKAYAVPEDAPYTRHTIIQTILEAQEPDGGFGLNSGASNLDITAMALQALAPYRNSTKMYSLANGKECTIKDAIVRALDFIGSKQTEDGSFGNSCSTAQVVIALCGLGIDPQSVSLQGHSAAEGLLAYQTENGLFRYLPEDTAHDIMATEQVILALSAMERLQNHERRLFDFREEPDSALRQQIDALNADIEALEPMELEQQAETLYDRYQQIPAPERSYVSAYWKLTDAMERSGMEVPEEDPALAYDLTVPTKPEESRLVWWIAAAVLVTAALTVTIVLRKKGKQHV